MISLDNVNYCEKCFEKLDETNMYTHSCQPMSNTMRFPAALPEGTVLSGKYLVGSVIGKGGFGITYLCFDINRKCRVAIKEYFPDYCAHRTLGAKTVGISHDTAEYKKGVEKFYKEAKLLAGFRNCPSIVNVLSFFQENNTAYLVMEYLDGCDLKTHFRSGAHFDENYVIFLTIEVLKGLKLLHDKKIYHRDISPDNIFICKNGQIKLIDFGSARTSAATYSVMLKPGFAPTEQYQTNGNQGPWTDIYEVGATAYYFLKGNVLEPAPSRVANDVLNLSGISPKFAVILSKMIAVKIEHRYKSVDDVIKDLVKMLNGGVTSPTESSGQNMTVDVKPSDNNQAYDVSNNTSNQSFFEIIKNNPSMKKLFITACILGGALFVTGVVLLAYFGSI